MSTTTNLGWNTTPVTGWLSDMLPIIQSIDTSLKPRTVTLNGTTPVVISDPLIKTTSEIYFNRSALVSTPGHITYTIVDSTSISFVSTGIETSKVDYFILKY